MFTRFLRRLEIIEDEFRWFLFFWFLFFFFFLVFFFGGVRLSLANVFLYIALMSRSYDLFAEFTFPLSRAHMIFLVSNNSNSTFVTVVYQLTNGFLLIGFDQFVIVKADLTSESSLAVCTIDVPSTGTRNVTVKAITSVWTSMISSMVIPHVAILTVVDTSKKSLHCCYTIIMIVSIPVDVNDFRLSSFLEL